MNLALRNLIVLSTLTGTAVADTPPDPDPRFGVMTHFAQGWDPAWGSTVRAGGLREVRDELYWNVVEAAPGAYTFPPRYEHYMAALARDGISPLIVLSFENPLYDHGETPFTDEGCAAYARYAVAVLRHYGPQIKAVEVWNEYNGGFNHGPASVNRAASYVKMLRATYAAVKRERPDVLVVGGATSEVPLPYWEAVMAAGGLAALDVLSVHPYRYGSPPEGIEDDIADLRRLERRFEPGAPKPIWATEIGWYLKASEAPGDPAIDEAVQAEYLVRAYALLLSAGVERSYWYLLHDTPEFSMGLAHDDAAHTPKLALTAMAALVRHLAGASFVRREATAGNLYSFLFQRPGGEERRVIWSLIPRHIPATGVTAARDYLGTPRALAAGLDLGPAPLLTTGPLRDLARIAPPAGAPLADSRQDFGPTPAHGWSYGEEVEPPSVFQPLTRYLSTDWKAFWTSNLVALAVSADEQHPARDGSQPVAAVRRWTSNVDGPVRISGYFRSGLQGDGVGVSVTIDGQRQFRTLLGRATGVERAFDLTARLHRGSVVDFAVDPGPAADIDFDATEVRIVIRREP